MSFKMHTTAHTCYSTAKFQVVGEEPFGAVYDGRLTLFDLIKLGRSYAKDKQAPVELIINGEKYQTLQPQ